MKFTTFASSSRVTLFSILLLFTSYTYGMEYHFKSLQGDPSEFNSFYLPSNQDSAALTSAISIPIKFNSEHMAHTSFYVDSDTQFGFCAMSPLADEFEYSFILPGSSHSYTLDEVLLKFNGNITNENLGIGLSAVYSSICYQLVGAIIGEWQVKVTLTQGSLTKESGVTNSIGSQVHSDAPNGYFLLYNDSPYKLRAYSSYGAVRGDHMQLNSELLDSSTGLRYISKKASSKSQTSQAIVLNPFGGQIVVDMHDDGLHADRMANDGFYGGHFVVNDTGVYQITTFMDAYTSTGVKFQRSVDQVIRVIRSNVSLEENTAVATTDGDFLNIKLRVRGQQDNSDEIVAYAQVWGKSLNGSEDVAIAWVSGISKAQPTDEDDELNYYGLDLNIQWIVKAQAQAPFTLRQVRVQDRGILALLDSIDELPVEFNGTITEHPLYKIHPSKIVITEEMHSGRRPDQYRRDLKRDAANGKKILVHGYCSDALAWPLSNFTDALLFQDPNANRKIDEFARLVLQFANESNVDSFSLIAHSQGGLVSLHIHTYYWSGMDLATGGYLIQSVGSPYHGTVMAGTVASLGWIFGYGCGANDDLTPEGAEAWLAGIPQDKQAAVHFYTTNGDPTCSLPSNWVGLSLPNDGVVAESYGQLEYGNNEGNYDGWCHTVAMSSPFQCMDADRNAIIDASAAL